MTRAVAVTVVDPSPLDLATGLDDLAVQLDDLTVLQAVAEPLLLVSGDVVLHEVALADLAQDPRASTMALVSRAGQHDLRIRAGRIVAVRTAVHAAVPVDATFAGALRVAPTDRAAAAVVARALADVARTHGWTGEPLGLLLLGLVRREVVVGAVSLDPWPWSPHPDEAMRARLDVLSAREVHALRLARATKSEDGVTATLVHRPLSRRLTPVALRLGLTPNQVTGLSVALGLAAAVAFGVGTRGWLVAGALLLQASFVLDCVDGEVARYRRAFSATGAWLDASTDRLKEFACYGGLAWGAARVDGHPDARHGGWLAALMLTVQTARHTLDYTFTAIKDMREARVVASALDDPSDPDAQAGAGADARATAAIEQSARLGTRAGVRTAKKLLHLGIGERWLVLSLFAALGRPWLALAVLLALALASLAYTTTGRVLRARSWPVRVVTPREKAIVLAQVDAGATLPARLAGLAAGPPEGTSRWLWVRPPVLRLLEYVALLALTVPLGRHDRMATAAFLLLLVVASHHYDELYRVLNRLTPPSRLAVAAGLGATGRVAFVAILALLARLPDPAPGLTRGASWALVAGLGMLFLVIEPARVLREVRSVPPEKGATGG